MHNKKCAGLLAGILFCSFAKNFANNPPKLSSQSFEEKLGLFEDQQRRFRLQNGQAAHDADVLKRAIDLTRPYDEQLSRVPLAQGLHRFFTSPIDVQDPAFVYGEAIKEQLCQTYATEIFEARKHCFAIYSFQVGGMSELAMNGFNPSYRVALLNDLLGNAYFGQLPNTLYAYQQTVLQPLVVQPLIGSAACFVAHQRDLLHLSGVGIVFASDLSKNQVPRVELRTPEAVFHVDMPGLPAFDSVVGCNFFTAAPGGDTVVLWNTRTNCLHLVVIPESLLSGMSLLESVIIAEIMSLAQSNDGVIDVHYSHRASWQRWVGQDVQQKYQIRWIA